MAVNYQYAYADIYDLTTGLCFGVQDTSNYILNPACVPIPEYNENYMFKYYWPLPEIVNSHDDFQGQWYKDAAHTIPWNPEG